MSSSSSSTSSMPASRPSRSGTRMRNLSTKAEPQIEISLEGAHETPGSYMMSYSTMDTLKGTVTITPAVDIRFDALELSFVGFSKITLEKWAASASASGAVESTHRFLKLVQPIDASTLPHPRILEAGKPYVLPFTFVIPDQLLPKSCPHETANDQVREAHLQLPPSLGDADVSGSGATLLDDMAPEVAKVIYGVQVRVLKTRESDGAHMVLHEKLRKVRVRPVFEEQPPLNVDGLEEYRLRQEKVIRKGLFQGRLGTLTMEAVQPTALRVPDTQPPKSDPVTTVAQVHLRFDPATPAAQPPLLSSLTTKLKATTYFATKPRKNFPSKAEGAYDPSQSAYTHTIPLSSLRLTTTPWTRHDPSGPSCSRRSSATTISTTAPTTSHHYTATLRIPITLPANKNFLPTFHSCLLSRIYRLQLALSVAGVGAGGAGPLSPPTLLLKLPVQVTAAGSEAGLQKLAAERSWTAERRRAAEWGLEKPAGPDEEEGANGPVALQVASLPGQGDEPPGYERGPWVAGAADGRQRGGRGVKD